MFEEAEFDDFDDNVAPSQQLLDDSSSSDPPTAPASPARTFGPNCGFGGGRRGAGGGSAAAVMNNSSSLTAPLTVPTPSAAFENTPDNKVRRRQALLQQREELGAGGGGGAFFKAGREDNATKAFGSSSSTSAATTTSDARMRNRRHSSNIDNALTAAERRHKAHNDTRLHRPGDKQYRFTCAPPTATNSSNNSKNNSNNNSGNRYDDTFVSGDAWGSNVCHCMVCEMSTAMSLVKAREEEMRGVGGGEHSNSTNAFSVPTPPPTVILWDLDNFGFKHMMIEASRLAKHTNFEAEASIESIGTRSGLANYMATLLNNDCDEGGGGGRRAMLTSPSASSHGPSSQAQTQQQHHHRLIGKNQKRNQRAEDGGDHKVLSFAQNTFFWFFHGACFARRHDTTPLDYVASLREDDPSLWGVLQRHSGGLLFTPCGGHSQAADEVMLCIALGLFPSAENSNTPAGHHHGQKRARDDSPPQLALPHLPPFPTVVVTRDKGLREMIAALAGGGSSNEHSSKDMGGGRAVDGGATNNNNRNDMATPNRNTAAACSPIQGAPIGHGGRGGGKANATSKANAKAAATSSPLSATILSQDQSSSHTPKANVGGGGGGGGGASFTAAVRCVDPQATGGTFVPFWAELTRSVEDARREFAAVTMMAEMLQQ